MAWQYQRAIRVGNAVYVRLLEPVRQSERDLPPIIRGAEEQEAAFVARAQTEIAGHLRVMNGMFLQEVDVTNTFRPPQSGGTEPK